MGQNAAARAARRPGALATSGHRRLARWRLQAVPDGGRAEHDHPAAAVLRVSAAATEPNDLLRLHRAPLGARQRALLSHLLPTGRAQ